jgi:SAM-dependent methyltransferase
MERYLGPKAREGSKVLEVGCGDGFFSGKLIGLGFDTTGVDLSPVGVQLARQRNLTGTFLVHDLTQPLPFDDDSFEGLWCSEVLEHLFSPLQVLREAHRVLRPGGVALFTTPYHGLLKNVAIALFAFDRHYDPTYPHIRFFTKNTLTALIEQAGLVVDVATQCGSQLGVRDWIFPTNLLVASHK